jgi:hypothetical protein
MAASSSAIARLVKPRGEAAHCARCAQSLHPRIAELRPAPTVAMRAEIQNIVDEIKQSVALLRRHL